jgi:hypothetical protein
MFVERMPPRQLRVRLLGVGVSGFEHAASAQLNLFPDEEHERDSRLDQVTDEIKDKFGVSSMQRALGMLHDVETKAGERGPNRDQYGE